MALAAVLPLICLQDAYRYVHFRRRKPHLAAASDAVWVLASIVAWPIITTVRTPAVAVALWGVGGGLSALFGALVARTAPAPGRAAIRWWSREARPLGGFLALTSVVYAVAGQVTILGLAAILGEEGLGELRAAQILFGPIALATTAISFFALPRLAAVRDHLTLRVGGLVAVGSAGLVALCVLVLFLAAPLLFPILYGSGFEARPALLVPLAIQMIVGALAMGPILLLKARMTGKPLAGTRILTSLVGVPLVLAVASAQGLVAAVWAMLIQAVIYVWLVWRAAARSLHLAEQQPGAYSVLGVRVDPMRLDQAAEIFQPHSSNGGPRVVHQCNAYNLLLASKDAAYRAVMNRGDLNLPDGWPAVWAGRRLGVPVDERVAGADLCDAVFRRGLESGLRHFFYGGTEASLRDLAAVVRGTYPGIEIAGVYAPPFRPITDAEREEIIARINEARPDVVWVGLGTPKQDFWMEEFRHRLDAGVLVGVGAVFDFLAGTKRRAPRWMQRSGLEWLHRLMSEPGRLWRRYLLGNPEFVLRVAGQLGRERLRRKATSRKLAS